jgi:large subunit ribosomal protein L32
MAVPKKRTGKCAQGHRRSQWKATLPTTAKCANCGESKLSHTVCEVCGHYGKDKPASIKLKEEH